MTSTRAPYECANRAINVVNASWPMTLKEVQGGLAQGQTPVLFQIGWDTLAIAVSKENIFVDSLTIE